MKQIEITKQVPVVGQYDVVVCGGGPAGFIAALAAARGGARTAIVEQYGFLGGMATAGLVSPLSVFTYNNERVIGGIPWEFIERLEQTGGGLIERPLGNVAFDPERYKLLCQQMVQEAGIDLYMHSFLSGCIFKGGGFLSAVCIENKNGTEALEADLFIDCTGDGDLAAMAGVPMQPDEGRPLQPLSTYFVLGGVDTDDPLIAEAIHHNKQGENCHCLPIRERLLALREELDLPEFGGPWFCTTLRPGEVTVNMTRTACNALDNRAFTAAEGRLRADAFRLAEVLKTHFEPFRNSYITAIAPHGGIRETRRIRGVHTITAEEYVGAFRYADSISRCAHPIDIHAATGTSQHVTFLQTPAYVPYRSLIAADFPNLLVAGRCISADKTAFASLRVQASCMGTGQAAGAAAALCAQRGETVQALDPALLVEKLKQLGAML